MRLATLAALIATALICVAAVTSASAQTPPLPPAPPEQLDSADHGGAEAPPSSATTTAPVSPREVRASPALRMQRRRAFRVLRRQNDVTAQAAVGDHELNRTCYPPYVTNKVGFFWATSASWWEYYCLSDGYRSENHASWFTLYYYSYAKGYWEYYGTWTHYSNSSCWLWWNAIHMAGYNSCS